MSTSVQTALAALNIRKLPGDTNRPLACLRTLFQTAQWKADLFAHPSIMPRITLFVNFFDNFQPLKTILIDFFCFFQCFDPTFILLA